jgi:hypothetical protein
MGVHTGPCALFAGIVGVPITRGCCPAQEGEFPRGGVVVIGKPVPGQVVLQVPGRHTSERQQPASQSPLEGNYVAHVKQCRGRGGSGVPVKAAQFMSGPGHRGTERRHARCRHHDHGRRRDETGKRFEDVSRDRHVVDPDLSRSCAITTAEQEHPDPSACLPFHFVGVTAAHVRRPVQASVPLFGVCEESLGELDVTGERDLEGAWAVQQAMAPAEAGAQMETESGGSAAERCLAAHEPQIRQPAFQPF